MTIADKLTLLASSKEALRIKLGLPKNLPFSEYYKYALTHPDASILALFKDGKQGVWYDPSDMSTLFQDVAGTVPVTKDGDPVGLILDKSGNNNHAMQSTSSARPIYHTDGNLHWIEFDGVDDFLRINRDMSEGLNHTLSQAIKIEGDSQQEILEFCHYTQGGGFRTLRYSGGLTLQSRTDKISRQVTIRHRSEDDVVFTATLDGTTARAWLNNATASTSLPSPHTPSSIDYALIGLQVGGSEYLKGRIYGVVTIAQVIDTAYIHNYLANKAGVTL